MSTPPLVIVQNKTAPSAKWCHSSEQNVFLSRKPAERVSLAFSSLISTNVDRDALTSQSKLMSQ